MTGGASAHEFVTESLSDRHVWLRIADPSWSDPLDPSFAAEHGGRWNPPNSHPTLYLNEDIVTARLNLRNWASQWPWEPEDLRPEHAPTLVTARLPRDQVVADGHTNQGLSAMGLPRTYPVRRTGALIDHSVCQPIGAAIKHVGLRGVRCRSAQTPMGAGRELAWFPATARSQAQLTGVRPFSEWFWA